MTDLIHSALAVVGTQYGQSPRKASAELVEAINADLGSNYSTNDLGKWRRAERPIPQPAQDWMLRVSIAWAVRQVGGTLPDDDAKLDALAAMLCPPGR